MKTKRPFRKNLFLLWIAAMLLGTPWSCGTNRATTMKLIKTDGEVGVENEKGKPVDLIENLRLYNGYGIGTQAESFAWIDLDDTKLAKMDEKSDVGIIKDGRKLELTVNSGGLFFHVTKPLEEDESMEIRTSTTICGIRGTCGWAESHGPVSYIGLLDGTVACSVTTDGKEETVTIHAKELLIVKQDGSHVTYEVKELTYKDVPEFVQAEIADEPFALEEESYTVEDFLGIYSSTDGENAGEAELGLDGNGALYFRQGNSINQSYSSYEVNGNSITATYQDAADTYTDTFTLNEDGSLTTEFGDEQFSDRNTTFAFERKISEQERQENQTEASDEIERFLGTYARDRYYGLQLTISDISGTEGDLQCSLGSNMHGGWMNCSYTDYSINGNELKATRTNIGANGEETVTDTFVLNDDGSISATFSEGMFGDGTYEVNDGSVFELTDQDG